MGRHSLWHMDMVPMAVVGVHSVWMWRWTLVCSSVGREQYKKKKKIRQMLVIFDNYVMKEAMKQII